MDDNGCEGCRFFGRPHIKGCQSEGYGAQQEAMQDRLNMRTNPPQPSPADRLKEAITKWEARYAHYLVHAQKMLDMEDLHGLWDAAMNASEVSNRIDQLRDDLAVIEGREP